MMHFNSNALVMIAALCISGRALAESEPFFCRQSTDCGECVLNGCSWAAGQCLDSCMQIADTKCYNMQPFPQLNAQQLCAEIEKERLDDQLCSSQEGCFSCTAAIKSTGESCQYYIDDTTKMGYCGSGGCDSMGNCPVESCSSLGGGNLPIPPPLPVNYNCETRTSCSSCLAGGSTCAWSLGRCHDSCDQIADASCWTLDTFQGKKTGTEICSIVEETVVNEEICQSASNCQECTNQFMVNGKDKCSWHTDSVSGWCGTGGCDMNGNCGSSSCPVARRGHVRGSN